MNTRLQVEHPVTEAITGLDLVEWQLRVAAGEPLPLQQHELRMRGHAIEARICAENPDKQFLPATGTLQVYRKPHASAFVASDVRFDDGVREGDAISPYYDSMIAKLIVHGDTREQALARLDAALAATHIVGLSTNVQFLRHVVASESFAHARLDTALIPREQAVLFAQERIGVSMAVAAAVAATLLAERHSAAHDPFGARDHWRVWGAATRMLAFEFAGERVQAQLQVLHDGAMLLSVGERAAPLQFMWLDALRPDAGFEVRHDGRVLRLQAYRHGDVMHLFSAAGATRITCVDLLASAGGEALEGGRLTAPMPGKLVSFSVQAGDRVGKGQALAVMEAMKMEHTIAAPHDGTVSELLYSPGDQVLEGAELLRLAVPPSHPA
jgi:3-methylcrotonyl-CoA carboxylase alpha subunit